MESHRSAWLAAFAVIGAAAIAVLAYALAVQAGSHAAHKPDLMTRPSMLVALGLFTVCLIIFLGILWDVDWLPRGRLTRNASVAKNLRAANHLKKFAYELRQLEMNANATDAQMDEAIGRVKRWLQEEEKDLVGAYLSDEGLEAWSTTASPKRQELQRRVQRIDHLHSVMHNRAEIGG